MDAGSGIVSWTAPDGTRHNLHTDPEESAAFFARADALIAGREDLRMILRATAFWLEAVTAAGLPVSDAVGFLTGRIASEIDKLIHLSIEDRLSAHIDQLLTDALADSEEEED